MTVTLWCAYALTLAIVSRFFFHAWCGPHHRHHQPRRSLWRRQRQRHTTATATLRIYARIMHTGQVWFGFLCARKVWILLKTCTHFQKVWVWISDDCVSLHQTCARVRFQKSRLCDLHMWDININAARWLFHLVLSTMRLRKSAHGLTLGIETC